jgi:hypothetical protein
VLSSRDLRFSSSFTWASASFFALADFFDSKVGVMRTLMLALVGLCAAMLWPMMAAAQMLRLPIPSLSRFTDNGDGTVTDNQTGLIWEKATGESNGPPDPSDVRNVNNTYAWCAGSTFACTDASAPPDGPAYTVFLATLNHNVALFNGTQPGPISGCFANHCDWRLPTVTELYGIVNANDPVLGPIEPREYWTSTTLSVAITVAFVVNFGDETANDAEKANELYVRAVRGVARTSALTFP